MNYKFFPMLIPVTALLLSCGGNNQTAESTKDTVLIATAADTVVKTVAEPVDTAAIIAAYEAEYAKTKEKNKKPEYKEKNKKHVAAYTEPEIASKPPKEEVASDPAGYNYKADKSASYPGGRAAFDKYFYKNFEYPDDALQNDVQGTIYAEVFIDEKGFVEKVEFPGHKLGHGLEEEVRRVIMGAHQLDPAIKNGVPAKQRVVLPIRVVIEEW